MATIPTYEKRFSIAQDLPTARAQSTVSASSPIGDALVRMGEVGQGIESRLKAKADDKAENTAAVQVSNILSSSEPYWQQQINEKTKAWKVGDPDLREGVGKDFDKWQNENMAKLPTDKSRQYFEKHAGQMRAKQLMGVYSFQEKATADKLNIESAIAAKDSENSVFSDPTSYGYVLKREIEAMLGRTDLDDAGKLKAGEQRRRELSTAAERGEAERDPAGYLDKRYGTRAKPGKGGAVGFSAVVAEVLKTEGGYVSKDGNSGAPANFGINQRANPDIDVASLTKDGAAKLYKARYWDVIGGDSLPPALQGTAMDAAVNQGPANANKWIAASGGDPAKFNALRRDHYDSLLKKPEYAGNKTSWMNRLEKYENAAPPADGAPVNAPSTFGNMDYEQQIAIRTKAVAAVKSNQAQAVANAGIQAASIAVGAQDIGSDRSIDLNQAKAQAVAIVERSMGVLDPVQRLSIESSVERAAIDRERDRKRSQDNTTTVLFDALDKNGGDYQALLSADAKQVRALPRADQDRLQKYAGAVATGETRVTDWQAYNMLINDPKVLKATNISAIKDKFSSREFAQIKTLQDKLLKDPSIEQSIVGDLSLVKSMMKDAGVRDDKKESQFFSLLQQSIDQELAATGKKSLTQTEIKKLANDLLVKEVTSPGFMWDTKEMAFDIKVPAPERAKIVAALQAQNMAASDVNILRLYRNKLQRDNMPKTGKP